MPRCCLPSDNNPPNDPLPSNTSAQPHAKPKHPVRLATIDDIALLADLLADAFVNDPVVRWILPTPEYDQRLFEVDIGYAYLAHKHSWLLENGSGAACWLPPGEKPLSAPLPVLIRTFAPMLLKFGFKAAKRGHLLDQAFERYRPQEPHYYLHMLGARQAMQGRGIGSALLKQGLSVVDQHNMPAYLESSHINNVPLYERHGFKVINQAKLGGDGPTVWYMWREAIV